MTGCLAYLTRLLPNFCWLVGIGGLENIHYSRVYNAPMPMLMLSLFAPSSEVFSFWCKVNNPDNNPKK